LVSLVRMPPSLCSAIVKYESGTFQTCPLPYCSKWSAVRIQPLAKLREAEQAELEWGRVEIAKISEEEKLRKELEDSKYQGL